MNQTFTPQKAGTISGILSILIWSTSIALDRSLTESLGTLSAASYNYLLSGILSCVYLFSKPGAVSRVRRFPLNYFIGCGSLFVVYSVTSYLSIGFSSNHQQVIEVGLINYLWPSLTLILSVPILKKKARISLIPGILIGFAGIYLAMFQNAAFSWDICKENLKSNFTPYILSFITAISWALYSNLSKRWSPDTQDSAIPFFLLVTGLILVMARFIFPEESHWTSRSILELIYLSIFPTILAYIFWETAMRKGKIILVVSLSYFTPLLSTIITCAYLNVKFGTNLFLACGLIVAASVICRYSITEGNHA